MALTATQSKSISGAARYFDESLTKSDYYIKGTEIVGTWNGEGTELLGLKEQSEVSAEQFKRLLSGLHPVTGEKLAQRLRKNRRPGLDLTFSVPKSVSLAWAINEDKDIEAIVQEAVHETMRDAEALMCRRVRTGTNVNTQNRKRTGNIIYSDFTHFTSRPVDGQPPDAHLHVHCFVMNLTHDGDRFYAAEPEEIFRQRPNLQARFEARLAGKLTAVGYAVTDVTFTQSGKLKRGWELKGIERATVEKFSKRTQQIEEFAAKHGITDADRKGQLGAKVRSSKDKGASLEELRQEWKSRLTAKERAVFASLKSSTATEGSDESLRAEAAVDYALEHHLYRQSTVEKHVIVGTALEYGLTVSPEAIEEALANTSVIQRSKDVRGDHRDFVTTKAVLEAEREMIAFAREGRGTRKAMVQGEYRFQREWLNDGQKGAVSHLLQSRDTVMALTGGAGTGKSSLMVEAVEAIEATGRKVFTFAPSTGACEVLQEKGFDQTKTVEHLLRNERKHEDLRNGVLWIDEAGLLDYASMLGVFRIAKEQNCRVVLSGDARQHASPRRGESFRILQQEAGLNVAKVQEVQRQKGHYKRAIELISLGHEVIDQRTQLTGMLAGWDLLDSMGKIREANDDDRHEELAAAYRKAKDKKRSTLVVSPTHAEKDAATEKIREALRAAGAIGTRDVEFLRLKSLNLSEAEKGDQRTYQTPGAVIQFHQNAKGFKKGERYRVCRDRDGKAALKPLAGGPTKQIPLATPDRFEVYAGPKNQLGCRRQTPLYAWWESAWITTHQQWSS